MVRPALRYARAANEFIHSLAAGTFPGAVMGVAIIRAGISANQMDAVFGVQKASPTLWLVLLGALFALVITGLVRISYYESLIIPDLLPGKRRMVLIKHVGFVTVQVIAIAWMFRLLPA